ncbi:MAG TPA: hypothetical protein ENK82_01265 [Campylobacterales bacterium]|nr:hypothetical protein [Campylobacterales bacterium]HHS91954.1 hypothetical protein [Campylobacterales bacterium]
MSQQEKAYLIEKLRNRLQAYRGFTQPEKNYAHTHLPSWIGTQGELTLFIQKFSEKFALDIKPFLLENKFIGKI